MAITIHCVFWEDFVRFSKHAEMAIYEINTAKAFFRVCAVKENIIVYKEHLPTPKHIELVKYKWKHEKASKNFSNLPEEPSRFVITSRHTARKTLSCGIAYSVTPRLIRDDNGWIAEFEYEFEPTMVSEFLSRVLETSMDRVVEGNLLKASASSLFFFSQ